MRYNIFYILILIFLCHASFGYDVSSHSVRVAIVDVQSILENSHAIRDIRKTMDSLSGIVQNEISLKRDELKSIEDNIIGKRSEMTEDEFQKEVNEFNKKLSDSQKNIHEKKMRLEQAHSKAVSEVHNITVRIIQDMSDELNLNLVLPSSQVLYAKDELNITHEVIARLNKEVTHIEVNY